eukprot:SAG31_NODE_11767_length_1000_cov_0.617092_2_plen_125_part_00
MLHADLSSSSSDSEEEAQTVDSCSSAQPATEAAAAAAASEDNSNQSYAEATVQLTALSEKRPDRGIFAVDRVDANAISPQEFVKKYINRALPVVLTGAMESWPAYADAERRWSFENMGRRFGQL